MADTIKGDIVVPLPVGDKALAAILATIRHLESGGNYTIGNTTSTASGAYQFLDSTWKALAVKVPSAFNLSTKAARYAPAAVQDAVAGFWVKQILESNAGRLSSVPLTWYVGGVYPSTLDIVPAGNKITPRAYAEKWLAQFQTEASKIVGANDGVIDTATGAVVSVIGPAVEATADTAGGVFDAATAVPRFLAMISDPKWVMRAVKVVGGVALVGVGVVVMARKEIGSVARSVVSPLGT